MRSISITNLKANTYYSEPLWIDERFMLLPADSPVTEGLIENLKKWGYKSILSHGILRPTPSGNIDIELNNKTEESEARRVILDFLFSFTKFIRKTYEMFDSNGYLNLDSITEQVKSTILMLKSYRAFILRDFTLHALNPRLLNLEAEETNYLYTHSARTTIITLTIGSNLKLTNFRLIELGIAAILHEVGMMKMPSSIVNKTGGLTEREKKIISTHPLIGLKMLQNYSHKHSNPIAQEILHAISQHHERLNGSGYPQGIRGESTTPFAKILAVACSYDAQISNRPFRESGEAHTVILKMLKETHSLYDEGVITALLNSISVFALGSYVQLKNASIGIIIDIGDNPKYPIIKLCLDENLQPYSEQSIIRTSEKETKFIISRVLGKREIQKLIARKLLPESPLNKAGIEP
ncbi:hypothetical protein S1OALGB6SA_2347 [Olavius algarvensis spirochete endosymbiont]|uniref:HD-GYP domain-containing protein n=1 Tax=Olavius algarvensis spirochete endosymbiont TaxID=260710 RepID=UPI00052C3B8F|nr:HD domain-containing phosphohydrolase [Olavius algarvensis spirochete endosymbiont]KGM43054.1 hypothetical protein JY97_09895 [Alkalispirochaeta odontotermitis]VDB01245.1 hypothetical protein S1OALGB6SA_2347 [Olavius algarvensis spirochete endosymbiont]